jgi:Zn-dependent protease
MLEIILIIAILLFSVMIHECAHGVVALWFGDDTAQRQGRLSLNIVRHIDLAGTIILPVVLLSFYLMTGSGIIFGWAKPVPVSVGNLRNPQRDYTFVSLAGPLSNILLAFVFALILLFSIIVLQGHSTIFSIASVLCVFGVKINIILAMFNLIPIPPLDGSHVLAYLLPYPLSIKYKQFARYGIVIILFLIITGTLKYPFLLADYFSRILLGWMISVGRFFG